MAMGVRACYTICMKNIFEPFWEFLIRAGLAIVFLYFGILAVFDPAAQAAIWITQPFYDWINSVLPIAWFMSSFGVLQIAIALSLILKIHARYSSLLAGLLLLSIVVNLSIAGGFFNDIVMRDLALAFAAFGLWRHQVSG